MRFAKHPTLFPYLLALLVILGISFYYQDNATIAAIGKIGLFFPLFAVKGLAFVFSAPEVRTLFALLGGMILTVLFWSVLIDVLRPPRDK